MTTNDQVAPEVDGRAEAGAPPAADRPAATAPRHRTWLVALAALALLTCMAVAMVTTAVQQTPTIDEPVYVGAAASYLDRHSLRLNPEHPPLGKLAIGAGLRVAGFHLAPGVPGNQQQVGQHLIYDSGHDPYDVMLAARLPMIVLTLLFGGVVLLFGRDVAGPRGGLVALALYAFSPDVVAHGSLATLDVPAAGFLLTAAWLLWRARTRPPLYLPLAGLALGAALATRMSTLPAVPVLLALAGLSVWSATPATRPAWRRLAVGAGAALGVAAVATAVVWASYLAVDPRLRWTAPADLPPVHGLRALAVQVLPFPQPYLDGMRIQFAFEDGTFGGFLLGRLYQGSLWYYLPVALLVKTPLGMLALWAAGVAATLAVPRLRAAAPYLLLVPAVLFAVAMAGSRDFGVRYVIFVPIFLAVVAGGVTALRWRVAHAGAAVAVLAVAVSSLRAFPYYLPYSNEAFGGPEKTYLRLHDSNVDWGQDLGRLADRLRERYPGERVWLVYKGSGIPEAYGIRASNPRTVPPEQVSGLLVVSDTSIDKADRRLKELIAGSRRVEHVGHSITIFRRP
jgi:4-amino-4-deoxy-L-arabinose transferase-like glycosyltransferase